MLLSGLPGDVESEDTYRDQMQSWLALVQGNENTEKVMVLADDLEAISHVSGRPGESVSGKPGEVIAAGDANPTDPLSHSPTHQPTQEGPTPKPSSVTLLHADRTNFLGLSQTLSPTNPLVVIAWGHGGRQGRTPVFHVRGARLVPADLKALADRASAVDSRWVLLFRGSGAFARELAGANRDIISSERDTLFASDPVGMGLLLKIVRADSALSFTTIAEQLGRATTAWYHERHLARTEEPTLWLPDQPPRLLASAEDDAFASTPASDSNAPPSLRSGAESSPEVKGASKSTPDRGDLPEEWKGITLVDAKKFLDSDGVTLRRRLTYTLGSSPAVATEHDEFVQVLTEEGERFGDFDVSYSPPYEDIVFLDCEVLPPAGKLLRLDPEAIREGGEESVGDYHVGRRKFFSLPGVVPGAVLHVRYRTQWKEFPLPHVSMQIPIDQELPVVEASVQITVPKDTPFHFALDGLQPAAFAPRPSPLDPVLKQTTYGVTYTWRLDNLPAQAHEALTPPHQGPQLLISTFADWTAFAKWYARISKLADEVTPEITAKATELTRQATSDREKVSALYNYVTRLRYVAVPLGVNSFRPHAAANVLQNQFGDCKDKANLLNALLRAVNIPANLVLVPRFSQAHDGLPGLAFNHAISQITLEGQTFWADTTDEVCRFGLLPPGDPGRNVLVIDGQTTTLTRLPAPHPKDHLLTVRGEVDCAKTADALPVILRADASGFPDYLLRAAARETKEYDTSRPLLAARFRPAAGSFALEKQSATKAAALDEPFSWRAEGVCIGICSAHAPWIYNQPTIQQSNSPTLQQSNTPTFVSLRAPFWLPKEWDLALHLRSGALFLNEGYPLTLDEAFVFTFPPKSQPLNLPVAVENPDGPLPWKIEWVKTDERKLLAQLHIELTDGELSISRTRDLQRQLSGLISALAATAEVSLP